MIFAGQELGLGEIVTLVGFIFFGFLGYRMMPLKTAGAIAAVVAIVTSYLAAAKDPFEIWNYLILYLLSVALYTTGCWVGIQIRQRD